MITKNSVVNPESRTVKSNHSNVIVLSVLVERMFGSSFPPEEILLRKSEQMSQLLACFKQYLKRK